MKTRSPRKAERPLSVQLRDFRRGARERAGAPIAAIRRTTGAVGRREPSAPLADTALIVPIGNLW